jgi:hypothetical protein
MLVWNQLSLDPVISDVKSGGGLLWGGLLRET